MRAALIPAASLCVPALLAGCGSTQARGPSAYQMTHPVIVENRKSAHPDAFYQPNPIRVHVGQSVTWKNTDSDPHDVTADDGTFFTGPIPSGGTATLRFTHAGTYRYFCTLHPDMHGVIIVTGTS